MGSATGTSMSLGLISIAKDLGFTWKLQIETDATAAVGVCRRRGLGKIRHLDVQALRIQDAVRQRQVALVNVDDA